MKYSHERLILFSDALGAFYSASSITEDSPFLQRINKMKASILELLKEDSSVLMNTFHRTQTSVQLKVIIPGTIFGIVALSMYFVFIPLKARAHKEDRRFEFPSSKS